MTKTQMLIYQLILFTIFIITIILIYQKIINGFYIIYWVLKSQKELENLN